MKEKTMTETELISSDIKEHDTKGRLTSHKPIGETRTYELELDSQSFIVCAHDAQSDIAYEVKKLRAIYETMHELLGEALGIEDMQHSSQELKAYLSHKSFTDLHVYTDILLDYIASTENELDRFKSCIKKHERLNQSSTSVNHY